MCIRLFFFFFKQKTAYEMRISDWRSDVCSSDLAVEFGLAATILSLQSLAVVIDLGLAVTASRELPALDDTHAAQAVIKRSERVLVLLYCGIAAIASGLAATRIIPVSVPMSLLICLSLLLIVWQNIVIVALISRQRFLVSTATQFLRDRKSTRLNSSH